MRTLLFQNKSRGTFVLALVLAAGGGCQSGAQAGRPDRNSERPTAIANSPVGVTDLNGNPANPFAFGSKKAAILIFVRPDCPISNHYAPEIERLHKRYSPEGLAFWLVYSDADTTVPEIQAHLKDYHLTLPAVRDPKHALVKRSGVRVTPEVAVFLAGGSEVYRGRIDDRYVDFGKERATPTERDLDQALAAIVKGEKIVNPKTRAIGCYIPEPGQ